MTPMVSTPDASQPAAGRRGPGVFAGPMVYTGNFTPPSGSKVRLNRMDYLPVINATAVSKEYKPQFGFAGGQVIKVVFDVAREGYVDVEQELAAGLARS